MATKDKEDLAEDRTDLAEDRTVMANERTYAGWLRTGFAAVAVGLGFQALFGKMEPPWVPKLIASVFLVIAIFVFIGAERKACAVVARLNAHQVKTVRVVSLRLISMTASLAAIGLMAAIWFLEMEA